MRIEVLDIDKLIEVNGLKEVTSPKIYSTKMSFDPDGLMSNEIFGLSKADRRSTFAYIDLKQKFIHPHIYNKVLKGLFRNVVYLVAGQKYYSIKDGIIVEDPDNGWTGLVNLYKHWNEIDWSKSKSSNADSKKLLQNLTRDQIFIDKFLVCPPAYRDIYTAGSVDSSDRVDPLNDLYQKLLRAVALISDGGLLSRTRYATQSKVQDLLVEIFNHFRTQISSKRGLIRRNLMGKSVDYGVRAVISAAPYKNERLEDNIVDVEHTAVPIAMCCSLFYPFIQSWVHEFFTREIVNDPNLVTFIDDSRKTEFTARIKDPDIQFSDRHIKKMIDDFCLNSDNRFNTVQIEVELPTKGRQTRTVKASMVLKGKEILPNNATRIIHRAMTITDILYLACVDVCEKRHVMVSRYPVGTDKGIFFSNIRVQSTVDHIHLVFNGKDYPFYPNIKLDTDIDHVGVKFIDTLVMSNSHCDGMGADFDGDVLSIRGLYSDEANAEADQIMNQKTSALNITGANAKVVAKEVFNALYELTKSTPADSKAKAVTPADAQHYLSMNPADITRTFLADTFADTVDSSVKNVAGKHKAHYNTWDTISVPANHFYPKQSAIQTTIGRYIANKFLFQGAGIIEGTGFINETFNKKQIGVVDSLVGQLYLEDKINRKQFDSYIDRRDTLGFWLNGMLAHSISQKMLKPLPEIEKRKAELYKKYEKELADGNVDVMTQISDELVAYAKELLKNDPGMDLYDSGDLDFSNNYKNNSILKGSVLNQITGEYDFIGTSFMDGIQIKDIPAHANSILSSQYPASISTADAGYMSKKLLALLQMVQVDEPGTDCGTKKLIPVTITPFNKNDMVYSYIQEGSGLVMLTNENINSYVGKTVMMRTPMTCLNNKICEKCAGHLFHLLGITNAGLYAVRVSDTSLNLGLKAKHASVVTLTTFNPDEIIVDI